MISKNLAIFERIFKETGVKAINFKSKVTFMYKPNFERLSAILPYKADTKPKSIKSSTYEKWQFWVVSQSKADVKELLDVWGPL